MEDAPARRLYVSGKAEMRLSVAESDGRLYVSVADVAEFVFNMGGRTRAARLLADSLELEIRRGAERYKPASPKQDPPAA